MPGKGYEVRFLNVSQGHTWDFGAWTDRLGWGGTARSVGAGMNPGCWTAVPGTELWLCP